MKVKAAIAFEAAKPLVVDEIELAPPKQGEVLVRLAATGVCHTDAFTLSGRDPEGLFPSVLGHEGAGVVEEVGRGRHLGGARRPRDPALHPRVSATASTACPARRTSASRCARSRARA